jgi:hypothetical protein
MVHDTFYMSFTSEAHPVDPALVSGFFRHDLAAAWFCSAKDTPFEVISDTHTPVLLIDCIAIQLTCVFQMGYVL